MVKRGITADEMEIKKIKIPSWLLKKNTSLQTKDDKGNMIKSLKNFSASIIMRTKLRNKEGVLSTPIAHYSWFQTVCFLKDI